jgi:hypothetical protein
MQRELERTRLPRQSPIWFYDPWVMLQQTIIDLEKIDQDRPADSNTKKRSTNSRGWRDKEKKISWPWDKAES